MSALLSIPTAERSAMRVETPDVRPAFIESTKTRTIRSLQIGAGWFPSEPGGLERYYFDLMQRLPSAGVASRGLVVGPKSTSADSHGVVSAFAEPTDKISRRFSLLRASVTESLSAFSPDIVAAHFALYARPMLSQLRAVPLVVHFHGPWADESRAEGVGLLASSLKRGLIERPVYRRAARVVTLSQAFAKLVCARYGVTRDCVTVVPGGIDTRRFSSDETRTAARAELGWPTDRLIVLTVRRLASRMGLENLIAAAADVVKKIPDALFLIAGKGRLAESLQKRIDAAGMKNHVRLLGFVSDDLLPLAYRAADLTVMPSLSLEGFGLVAAESLASGTPVLVTPVGGLPEVVRDLDPRAVLASADVPDLANGLIETLLRMESLPSPEACRAFASRYDWSVVAPAIATIYRDVIDSHRQRSH